MLFLIGRANLICQNKMRISTAAVAAAANAPGPNLTVLHGLDYSELDLASCTEKFLDFKVPTNQLKTFSSESTGPSVLLFINKEYKVSVLSSAQPMIDGDGQDFLANGSAFVHEIDPFQVKSDVLGHFVYALVPKDQATRLDLTTDTCDILQSDRDSTRGEHLPADPSRFNWKSTDLNKDGPVLGLLPVVIRASTKNFESFIGFDITDESGIPSLPDGPEKAWIQALGYLARTNDGKSLHDPSTGLFNLRKVASDDFVDKAILDKYPRVTLLRPDVYLDFENDIHCLPPLGKEYRQIKSVVTNHSILAMTRANSNPTANPPQAPVPPSGTLTTDGTPTTGPPAANSVDLSQLLSSIVSPTSRYDTQMKKERNTITEMWTNLACTITNKADSTKLGQLTPFGERLISDSSTHAASLLQSGIEKTKLEINSYIPASVIRPSDISLSAGMLTLAVSKAIRAGDFTSRNLQSASDCLDFKTKIHLAIFTTPDPSASSNRLLQLQQERSLASDQNDLETPSNKDYLKASRSEHLLDGRISSKNDIRQAVANLLCLFCLMVRVDKEDPPIIVQFFVKFLEQFDALDPQVSEWSLTTTRDGNYHFFFAFLLQVQSALSNFVKMVRTHVIHKDDNVAPPVDEVVKASKYANDIFKHTLSFVQGTTVGVSIFTDKCPVLFPLMTESQKHLDPIIGKPKYPISPSLYLAMGKEPPKPKRPAQPSPSDGSNNQRPRRNQNDSPSQRDRTGANNQSPPRGQTSGLLRIKPGQRIQFDYFQTPSGQQLCNKHLYDGLSCTNPNCRFHHVNSQSDLGPDLLRKINRFVSDNSSKVEWVGTPPNLPASSG